MMVHCSMLDEGAAQHLLFLIPRSSHAKIFTPSLLGLLGLCNFDLCRMTEKKLSRQLAVRVKWKDQLVNWDAQLRPARGHPSVGVSNVHMGQIPQDGNFGQNVALF